VSPLTLLPDVEALVGSWLREHEDIATLNARVGSKTPDSRTRPWIRVTRLDAPRLAKATFDHAIHPTLQLDCYAGKAAMDAQVGRREANLLGATARAVLMALWGTTRDDVAIGAVNFLGDRPVPDTTQEPALERVILTVEIVLHAT
jgi:hypothetical protein